MNSSSFFKRFGVAVGIVAGAALVLTGPAHAGLLSLSGSLNSTATTTVNLPAVGKFQLCVGAGSTEVGKCDSTPLLAAGTLKVTVTGNTSATLPTITATTKPVACGGVPGVQVDVSGASAGSTLTAAISDTSFLGSLAATTAVSVQLGTAPASVRVCLAL